MKTVFVSFYEAYPPDSGAATVTYNCAKALRAGGATLLQCGAQDGTATTPEGVNVVTVGGAASSRWAKLRALPSRLRRMAGYVVREAPDLVMLEGASWVVYHRLLQRKLRRAGLKAPLVYHAHNVEYVLRSRKHGRWVRLLTRWAEGGLLREADHSFAVSAVDADQFARLYGVRPRLLPNGVDVDAFASVSAEQVGAVRARYGIPEAAALFMGLYAYPPNREAVDFLVGEVFARVVENQPEARLVVIGGQAPHHAPWLLNPGTVPFEEVPAVVRACRVGLAPIFSGSGTRLKILEYLAAGLPVVATAKGAEGLALRPGHEIVLAEDATGFAREIVALLADRDRASSLGRNGRAVVEQEYAWPRIMATFCRDILGRDTTAS